MSTHLIRAVAVLILGVSIFLMNEARPASAGVPYSAITSSGPIENIYIGNDLSCQIDYEGDSAYQLYPPGRRPGDCGTFIVIDGTLYAPDFSSHDFSATSRLGSYTPFTPASQSGVTGTGTASDPYSLTTVVNAGGTGIEIAQTDSYVSGEESYRTDVKIRNSSTLTRNVILYRAGDCYLSESDYGYGVLIPENGAVGCARSANNSPSGRIELWSPITPGSHYYESHYSSVWEAISERVNFPDTCDCTTNQDNGAGISWSLSSPAGTSATLSHITTFSPLGVTPTCETSPIGLDGCGLLPGDILVKRASLFNEDGLDTDTFWIGLGGSYFTHSALYVGDNMIVEAPGSHPGATENDIIERSIEESAWWQPDEVSDWAVIRPTDEAARISAVARARELAADEALFFDISASKEDPTRYYCSKVVWRAYSDAGLEVDPIPLTLSPRVYAFRLYYVTPDELYLSIHRGVSTVVQEQRASLTRTLKRRLYGVYSPAVPLLIDPQGRRSGVDPATGITYDEIPGALFNGPASEVKTVSVPDQVGEWRLIVTGTGAGSYSLESLVLDADTEQSNVIVRDTVAGQVDSFVLPAEDDELITPAGMVGDANCDGAVDPVDATLILQYAAAILSSITCQGLADSNEDGTVNSLDAALILQFSAGLLGSLPP